MTKDFPQNFSFLCPIYPKTMLRAVARGAVRRGPIVFLQGLLSVPCMECVENKWL